MLFIYEDNIDQQRDCFNIEYNVELHKGQMIDVV